MTESLMKTTPFIKLFKYASSLDRLYFLIGLVFAFISGLSWPVFVIYYGFILDIFVEFEHQRNFNATNNRTIDHFLYETYYYSLSYAVTVLIYTLCVYLALVCFNTSAINHIRIIKIKLFKSILSQEIAWFDGNSQGDFSTKMIVDLKKLEDGIAEKLGCCFNIATATVTSTIAAFYFGWKLTIVVLASMPAVMIITWICFKIQMKCAREEVATHAIAGGIAQEALSSIRTVFAFGGESTEVKNYSKSLQPAMRNAIKRNFYTGLINGIVFGSFCLAMTVGTFYGVHLILTDGYTIGQLILITWCVMYSGRFICYSAPYFETFQLAKVSATEIFKVIEKKSNLNPESKDGEKIENFDIQFNNVHFAYPTRKSVKVLNNINFSVNSGETVALVGPSGCGKSTIINLIQRFYNTDSGDIKIGGRNINDINLGWLRKQIGVVNQEPVLFDLTIEENILLGLTSDCQDKEIKLKLIKEAAIEANADDFISQLPNQYQTLVGDRGAQLSGGQKQRIAIARALISQPKILLLDEATSSLDPQNELLVQEALNRSLKTNSKRTTIIVAHRLSTIKNADRILYMENGEIKEVGSHEELMQLKGLFYKMVVEEENKLSIKNDYKESETQNYLDNGNGNFSKDLNEKGIINDVKKHFFQLRLIRMFAPDKYYVLIGIGCAFVYGLITPVYSHFFGEFVNDFTIETNANTIWNKSIIYAFLFLVIGIVLTLSSTLQMTLFGVAGERLTFRLRKLAFSSMLRQEVAWFDHPDNAPGSLCARLASDAANVQGASGSRISILSQSLSCVGVATVWSFWLNWKIALLNLLFIPLIVAGNIISASILSDQLKSENEATEKAAKIAVEAITNIRTVASLNQENYFLEKYAKILEDNMRMFKRQIHFRALALSSSLSVHFFCYSAAYFYAGHLIADNQLSSGVFFKIIEMMIFGAHFLSQSSVFTSDYAKAKIAAANIFKLIDRKPLNKFNNCKAEPPNHCDGTISLRDVQFTYPSRPEAQILKGLSFDIDQEQTVALVGSSGCGKTTIVNLLERFYNANHGQMTIDGKDINSLSPDWLRSQMSLVSQDPVLFSRSIGDNIAYGDNRRSVSLDEIIEAAQQANIHKFIVSLPMGYDTPVGNTQLSGGQKQRVCIARALVRKPKILLLDEATSALDSASEKAVQSALDSACVGRTCLVIAHRLNTIRNADKIVVIQDGVSVEEGTHKELMIRKGAYFKLYNIKN